MRDINEILPKIPNMRWGALTNMPPTNSTLKALNRMLPHDGRWHSVITGDGWTDVDGVEIRKKTAESMT